MAPRPLSKILARRVPAGGISLPRARSPDGGVGLQAVREVLAQLGDLGRRREQDVGLPGIPRRVVLVVGLGLVEGLQGRDLGDDRRVVGAGLVELPDVGLGHPLLLLVRVEDGRAVLGPLVRALAVELGGVVGHGEEDLEQLAVAHLGGVEAHLDGFGVAGAAGADDVVVGRVGGAAGVARGHVQDAVDLLEHGLDAPEAAAGQHGRPRTLARGAVEQPGRGTHGAPGGGPWESRS